jgi:hypothetical protein
MLVAPNVTCRESSLAVRRHAGRLQPDQEPS